MRITCCAHDSIDSVGNGPYTLVSAAAVLYCHILPAGGAATAPAEEEGADAADAVAAPDALAEGACIAEPKYAAAAADADAGAGAGADANAAC